VTSSWAVAASLDTLLAQLDAVAPDRSKISDGSIGDAAHQRAGTSDHLVRVIAGRRLVSARDFTHDPAGGLDCQLLADALRLARDPRVKYVIWRRRIMAGDGGPQPWTWRPYGGANPHDHHLHLSVVATAACQDPRLWELPGLATAHPLRLGSRGGAVRALQAVLGLVVDGIFGPDTDRAVRAFQAAHGLVVDGVVGPATTARIQAL